MKFDRKRLVSIIPYLIVIIAMYMVFVYSSNAGIKKLDYIDFIKIVDNNQITEVTVSPSATVIDFKGKYKDGSQIVSFTARIPNNGTIANDVMEKIKDIENVKITNPYDTKWMDVVLTLLQYGVILIMVMWILSRVNNGNSKAMEFGNTRARLETDTKVRFDDVAGCDEEKEEMQELIEYLRSPKKFAKMNRFHGRRLRRLRLASFVSLM